MQHRAAADHQIKASPRQSKVKTVFEDCSHALASTTILLEYNSQPHATLMRETISNIYRSFSAYSVYCLDTQSNGVPFSTLQRRAYADGQSIVFAQQHLAQNQPSYRLAGASRHMVQVNQQLGRNGYHGIDPDRGVLKFGKFSDILSALRQRREHVIPLQRQHNLAS